MAGIYIHIPYCRKACIYCNFHFSTSLGGTEEMVDAICREMMLRKNEAVTETETVYFGGGTPGILESDLLVRMLEEIRKHFRIVQGAEITLEANPDDVDPVSLRAWKDAGINRLSLGVQSFNQQELNWMNRSHSAERSVQSLQQIREAGFENFSADLIFGSPLSKKEILEDNINRLLKFEVPHISCYALTAEPRTRLHKMIREKASPSPDEDMQADHFFYIMERLVAAGYEHYEISNFSLPGFRSRHNSSYWKGVPYLGFGPSAHSFDGIHTRSFNVPDNRLYTDSLTQGNRPFESETLTAAQQLNEFIMIRLRTGEGIDMAYLAEKFGEDECSRIIRSAKDHIHSDAIVMDGNFMRLTNKGKLMADGIASDFFRDEKEEDSPVGKSNQY